MDLASLTADPDDKHVCALAIVGGADLLITADTGYDVAALAERGIALVRPDACLVRFHHEVPRAVGEALVRQAAAWGGGRTLTELLDALDRAGAPTFAARVRADDPSAR